MEGLARVAAASGRQMAGAWQIVAIENKSC